MKKLFLILALTITAEAQSSVPSEMVVALVPQEIPSGCTFTSSIVDDSWSSLLSAEIEILFQNHESVQMLRGAPQGESYTALATDYLTKLKRQRTVSLCSSFLLGEFKNSKDENFRMSSLGLALGFAEHAEKLNVLIGKASHDEFWTNIANNTKRAVALSDFQGDTDQLRSIVENTVTIALMSRVDESRLDEKGKRPFLIFSSKQLSALKAQLRESFPELATRAPQKNEDFYLQSARVVYDVLCESKFKPSDSARVF